MEILYFYLKNISCTFVNLTDITLLTTLVIFCKEAVTDFIYTYNKIVIDRRLYMENVSEKLLLEAFISVVKTMI